MIETIAGNAHTCVRFGKKEKSVRAVFSLYGLGRFSCSESLTAFKHQTIIYLKSALQTSKHSYIIIW